MKSNGYLRKCLAAWFVASVTFSHALLNAAEVKTKNVFLITTDGLRWQEIFTGAEKDLMSKTNGGVGNEDALKAKFWRNTEAERREVLLPFIWGTVAKQGQVLGNQAKGSIGQVTNGKNFSYPGYSEFLTGIADPRIDSNDKKPNVHTNVFEWLNLQPTYKGKVTAVCNWDVISWIMNTERSGIPMWTGYDLMPGSKELSVSADIKQMAKLSVPVFSSVIHDTFMFQAVLEHVKKEHPRAMYLAFGETDEWAHEGRYDRYLHAAHNVDAFLSLFWATLQSLPEYKDQTTLIITSDHGRGTGPYAWKSHGQNITESAYIWTAVIGPDTVAKGEVSNVNFTQSQIAATVAAALGEDFSKGSQKAAKPIVEVIAQP